LNKKSGCMKDFLTIHMTFYFFAKLWDPYVKTFFFPPFHKNVAKIFPESCNGQCPELSIYYLIMAKKEKNPTMKYDYLFIAGKVCNCFCWYDCKDLFSTIDPDWAKTTTTYIYILFRLLMLHSVVQYNFVSFDISHLL